MSYLEFANTTLLAATDDSKLAPATCAKVAGKWYILTRLSVDELGVGVVATHSGFGRWLIAIPSTMNIVHRSIRAKQESSV